MLIQDLLGLLCWRKEMALLFLQICILKVQISIGVGFRVLCWQALRLKVTHIDQVDFWTSLTKHCKEYKDIRLINFCSAEKWSSCPKRLFHFILFSSLMKFLLLIQKLSEKGINNPKLFPPYKKVLSKGKLLLMHVGLVMSHGISCPLFIDIFTQNVAITIDGIKRADNEIQRMSVLLSWCDYLHTM